MRALSILLLMSALAACRAKDPAPSPGIERLMGKWKLVAREVMKDGERVWKEETGENPDYEFTVRFDGVILDREGFVRCCDPPYYFINGARFDVVPRAEVKSNSICQLVDCAPCLVMNYDLQDDGSLFYSSCHTSGLKQKYVKQ